MAYLFGVLFVETPQFTARVLKLIPDEAYRELQRQLAERPDLGIVIPGTGGIRKIRWSGSGRGKRGGVRVLYYWNLPGARILMLFVFAKNERDDLTPKQRAALRQVVEREYS